MGLQPAALCASHTLSAEMRVRVGFAPAFAFQGQSLSPFRPPALDTRRRPIQNEHESHEFGHSVSATARGGFNSQEA